MNLTVSVPILFTLAVLLPQKVFSEDIEVLHMWRTDSEQRALLAIKEPLIERGVNWNDYWVDGNFRGIQSEFARRISIGDQPTVVQWIITDEMEKLVMQNTIRKLEDENNKFSKLYHPEVFDLVAYDGGIAALPIGIHTQNHIVYNKDLLEEFGLSPANSWEELLSYGPILEEHDIDLIATSDMNWQARNLGISVFSGFLDHNEFTDLQTQGHDIEHLKSKLYKSIDILSQLRKFTNRDNHKLDWEVVSKKVADGEALVQVLGDYIVPEFPDWSKISCGITPQSKYILWGVDGFIFPLSDLPSVNDVQDSFIEVATSPSTIQNYVVRKGGIPVTTNVLPEDLDSCSGNILNDWNQSDRKLWMSGEAWRKRLGVLGLFLNDKWQNGFGDINAATDELIMLLHSVD